MNWSEWRSFQPPFNRPKKIHPTVARSESDEDWQSGIWRSADVALRGSERPRMALVAIRASAAEEQCTDANAERHLSYYNSCDNEFLLAWPGVADRRRS
jgi:hypothetical protein